MIGQIDQDDSNNNAFGVGGLSGVVSDSMGMEDEMQTENWVKR